MKKAIKIVTNVLAWTVLILALLKSGLLVLRLR